MATSTITNTITDPSGVALAGVKVVARLVPAPAFRTSDGSEVAPVVETVTDSSGEWSLVLERNEDVTPSGTHYEVVEYLPSKPRTHTIVVSDTNQSLLAALVVPPPAADGPAYLTQAAGDARYQQLGAFGSSAEDVALTGSAGVSTAAARADHVHGIPDGLITPGKLATGYRLVLVASSAPTSPEQGQLWLDSATARLRLYTGSEWVYIGGDDQSPYSARAYRNSAWTIPAATTTTIVAFDTESYDYGNHFTTGSSAGYLPSVAGLYHVSARISWALNNNPEEVALHVYVNGGQYAELDRVFVSGGVPAAAVVLQGSTTVYADVGQEIDIRVQKIAGGNAMAGWTGSAATWVTIDKVP